MSEKGLLKLAVVTPIPTPYRDGFWNVLSAREDVDLVVYYCAAGKGDRPWRGDWPRTYKYEVLPGRNLLAWCGPDASAWDNPGIVSSLQAQAPEAVLIGGYNHPTMLRAIRYCIAEQVPFFLMSESHLHGPRSRVRRLLKDRLVKWVVNNMAGGFPTGKQAADYLRFYGAMEAALTHLPNVPDIERIAAEVQKFRFNRTLLKGELGLKAGPLILFAGRLIPKKGAHRVIEALSKLPLNVVLAIVGDGPEKGVLERQAHDSGLAGRVFFSGFVEPEEMTRWYAAADLFVLPSQETWGVVVIEALAAGLPVVVSNGVGCHPDIVSESALGRVVDDLMPGALVQALAERLTIGTDTVQFDAAWQPLARGLSYLNLADQLVRHVRDQNTLRTAV